MVGARASSPRCVGLWPPLLSPRRANLCPRKAPQVRPHRHRSVGCTTSCGGSTKESCCLVGVRGRPIPSLWPPPSPPWNACSPSGWPPTASLSPIHTWPARTWRHHKPGQTPRHGRHEARPRGARRSIQHQTRAQISTDSMTLAQSQTASALHQTHHNTHTFISSTRQPEDPTPTHQTSRRHPRHNHHNPPVDLPKMTLHKSTAQTALMSAIATVLQLPSLLMAI